MSNFSLSLMTGTDIPIPECRLILHQPQIREIGLIGEDAFFSGANTLCLRKSMVSVGQVDLKDISIFQIFLKLMNEKSKKDKRNGVKALMELLFPKYKLIFTPQSMILNGGVDIGPIQIDESNFELLQDVVREVLMVETSSNGQQSFNPQGKRAKEIADKLMIARQKLAKEKGSNGSSILSQYVSILTIGLNSMSLNDCLNLTVYQLYDLIERYHLYLTWDIDIRSRFAGAKSDSAPENWMKNIH